jgi:hypothetical protein
MLARATLAGGAMLAPVAIALAVIAAQLLGAARRFRRIVATRGSDIDNLMSALDDMAVAYGVQRWLWTTVFLVTLIALVFTVVAR